MDNLINVHGVTLEDVRNEGNHNYAICKTSDGATLQFPIDPQYLQQFRESKGQELNADVICHWQQGGSRTDRSREARR